jgi:L-serine dehydratase
MSISVFDLFKIGIGPSSSHTVGPMRAARGFALALEQKNVLQRVHALRVELFGSLGATGRGHGTDKALFLGLEGDTPDGVDIDSIEPRQAKMRAGVGLNILGKRSIGWSDKKDIVFHRTLSLPIHPNGMRFHAHDETGAELLVGEYYSIGGGFVVDAATASQDKLEPSSIKLAHPFKSAEDLLRIGKEKGKKISQLMLENERAWRSDEETRKGVLRIWRAMEACVARGCRQEGQLPGGLAVRRRAPLLIKEMLARPEAQLKDPLTIMDWVNLYAMAVNEENAAGGRVVTAPTNGAAGIVPAVLHYYDRFCPGANEDGIVRYLLTAGAIGILYKENASISGAEVGCQGEVGVACSMAAGGLVDALGGTNEQAENAAEIGMEHNLGLTCDPIGGLVQIPCIERNAMGAIKAINAARMALRGDGTHYVSLDRVIATMRQTGADMSTSYKETSRGGLAAAVPVPVNVTEC